jgi:hypothetical protein
MVQRVLYKRHRSHRDEEIVVHVSGIAGGSHGIHLLIGTGV